MKKKQIIKGILGIFLLFGCGNKERIIEKFSPEKPYAVEIKKERSFYQANKLSKRLLQMGLDAYIIQNSDSIEDDGEWYYILCGNIENLDSAKNIRERIAINYKLQSQNLKIVAYSNFRNAELNLDSIKQKETKRITSNKPDVKKDIFDVLEKFPESNVLFVKSATVFNTPHNLENKKGFDHVYSMKMDLPRGIKKKLLIKNTTAFSEVIYKDNLYEDRVTIGIGKIRTAKAPYNTASFINTSNNESYDIAEEYADLILETGEYLFEEKKEIVIESYTKLYGYQVTIETKRDYFRTYLILVDASNQYIIFSQSTDKSEKELVQILSDVGKGEGLLNYDEFYNVFSTIPEKLADNDEFIGFTIDKIGWSYAQEKGYSNWAKLYVGHWAANGYFYNSKKGLWSYGLFDILTQSKRDYISNIYANTSRAQRIDVGGVRGHIIYNREYSQKWGFYNKLEEINFGIGRYTAMVDNTNNSWLNKDELKERAEALQFEKIIDSTSKDKPII
jgi:hypothetical protein